LTGERERERGVERGVCTNKPFLEFLWCDDNLRILHGVGKFCPKKKDGELVTKSGNGEQIQYAPIAVLDRYVVFDFVTWWKEGL
jgi:hypothetical protein